MFGMVFIKIPVTVFNYFSDIACVKVSGSKRAREIPDVLPLGSSWFFSQRRSKGVSASLWLDSGGYNSRRRRTVLTGMFSMPCMSYVSKELLII